MERNRNQDQNRNAPSTWDQAPTARREGSNNQARDARSSSAQSNQRPERDADTRGNR
jgi:hypothetical protein